MKKTTTFRLLQLAIAGTAVLFTNYIIAQSHPTPYNGWPNNYTFNNWAGSNTIGTFPANMVFHYAAANVIDPALTDIVATADYDSAYNLTSKTRIEGLGTNGVSFVNTSPGHSSSTTGNLGETVLALNTTGRDDIEVSWTAGTISSGRTYMLRAQYRIGTTGSYIDLPYTNLSDIEYTSDSATTNFGPIVLPSTCDNQAVVQIRWAYYYGGSGSGSRAKINLTNITVSSSAAATTGINKIANGSAVLLYPNPVSTGEVVYLNQTVSGTVYDAYGRSVLTVKNNNRISTTNCSKGLYTLQTTENGTIRFVIN